jgi:hypothetical protein
VDLELVIEGVTDLRLVEDIKRQVRRVCKGAKRDGEWSVFVSPSETRGQWDLGVREPLGRHFAYFNTDRADELPRLVAEKMRTFLA